MAQAGTATEKERGSFLYPNRVGAQYSWSWAISGGSLNRMMRSARCTATVFNRSAEPTQDIARSDPAYPF